MSLPNLHHSWGALLRAQFDCSQQPLPNNLEVLLCFLDGAERRRHVQSKLNTFDPPHRVKFDRPVDVHWVPADQVPDTGPDWTATNGIPTLCVKPPIRDARVEHR